MNGVIIVAAGSGSRMNMGINKQFIQIKGKEILAYTIDKFYNNKNIDKIVVVSKESELEFIEQSILNKYKFHNISVVSGGKERQDSVYNGLLELGENYEIVLVHDGARPFITNSVIDESIEEAIKNNAVVVGVPVKDTIKVVNNHQEVVQTPKRDLLWMVQTPQVFKYNILKNAYDKAYEEGFYGTDDAMLVERSGQVVKMINGSYDNIKITTVEDLDIGEQIINKQK